MADRSPASALRRLIKRSGWTQEALARAAGFARRSSLQRYIDDGYARKTGGVPIDVLAKVAPHLYGRGEPPIKWSEIWALSESGAGIGFTLHPVQTIPIVAWSEMHLVRQKLTSGHTLPVIEVAGLPHGNHVAFALPDEPGALVIIDLDDVTPVEGLRYAIIWQDAPTIRRWGANPPRWEPVAGGPPETIFPTAAVQIIGRAIRKITNW